MKNWDEMISDLQQSGMTYAEIGEAAGIAGSTIGDLATGRSKSPRGNAAIKLHALHALLGKPASDEGERDRRDRRSAALEGSDAAETNKSTVPSVGRLPASDANRSAPDAAADEPMSEAA